MALKIRREFTDFSSEIRNIEGANII